MDADQAAVLPVRRMCRSSNCRLNPLSGHPSHQLANAETFGLPAPADCDRFPEWKPFRWIAPLFPHVSVQGRNSRTVPRHMMEDRGAAINTYNLDRLPIPPT
jgi:hypothetical protein